MNKKQSTSSDNQPSDTLSTLTLYRTTEHPCSYLEEQQSSLLFADPSVNMSTDLYSRLALLGFRRSGAHIYKPACRHCNACIPTRIPAHEFAPNRSQMRNYRRNADLRVNITEPKFSEEHFALYQRYMAIRHPGGGMQTEDPEQYMNFLASLWSETVFYEFRLKNKLISVAIVDRLDTGLSAMYTYYDPTFPQRSLGTYAILWEIQETCRVGLTWLYLGYWVEDCDKMRYKGGFKPLQVFIEGRWQSRSNIP